MGQTRRIRVYGIRYSIHGTVYDPLTQEWSQIEWLSSISLRSYLKALKIGSGSQNLLVWAEWDLESEKNQLKVGSFSLGEGVAVIVLMGIMVPRIRTTL